MTNPLYDALFAPLAGNNRPFLTLADDTVIGADAFHRMLSRYAEGLRAAGLQPGDRVAVQASKSPQMLALYGAAVACGAVFLPLNPAYTAEELDYFITDCGAQLLLVDPAQVAGLSSLAQNCGVRLAPCVTGFDCVEIF